jgi:hypothetical protein
MQGVELYLPDKAATRKKIPRTFALDITVMAIRKRERTTFQHQLTAREVQGS